MLPPNPQLPRPPHRNSKRTSGGQGTPSSSSHVSTSSASSQNNRYFTYSRDADCILSSSTQTSCPSFADVRQDITYDDPGPEEIFHLRLNLSRYTQIAATPDDMELKYTGPLLQRLASIRIVTRGTKYTMSDEQKKSWQWLEDTLHHAFTALSANVILPFSFAILPYPSQYGYLRDHKTHRHALRCAKTSRLAFHSLLGLVNLFYGRVLWRCDTAPKNAEAPAPSPSDLLLQYGLSDAHVRDIISALQPEILGRCVGVIFDPPHCEMGVLYPWLNRIQVPVWVIVGKAQGPYNPATFKNYQFIQASPTKDEFIRIRTAIDKANSQAIPSIPSDTNPDSLDRWTALVEVREKKRVEFLSTASDNIKARVRERLQNAAKFVLPSRRDGTRFFLWYRSKKGRFRGELDCEDAKTEFETRPKEQFVYDEISNEWDICSLFECDVDALDGDPGFEFDEPNTNDSGVSDVTVAHSEIKTPPTLPSDHNEVGRSILYNREISQDILFASSLEDVLSSRYGLVCCSQTEIQSQSDYTAIQDAQFSEIYTVRKYLMEMNLPLTQPKNEFAIRYFISCFLLDITPPSILWDLHPNNIDELVESNVRFKYTFVQDNARTGYLLHPQDERYNRPWDLLIHSAVSVVQGIRERWGPSLEDVVLSLFERGINFTLVFNAQVAHPSFARPRTVFESILRPHGWLPDKYEYADYENRRGRLLNLPHVRVAVAQGGILWRLCKQELASDIPNGPSKDVQFFADTSPDAPKRYLSDTLSDDEINILCGVYHIATGRGNQTAISSWWPTPKQWSSSGLDVGYWNHSAENVFQSRLKAIREGRAELRGAKQWKSEMSYYKNPTRKFIGAVEKECIDFLQNSAL
ncbi:uncharacterized protein EDB91DRAFT_1088023 [Suillus paluster]|uniref:uncharacterized protein n=1 Tax=Suillus paluster TaxID=48578 RepID=UPI001B861A95|nr:uncharacterized protein EDB91DRAFT_1088023 [Suillus paluster]KAG1722729.1 hypothetical protein EDB91DRAFT_1088023 [Suillus paluster]